MIINDLDVIQLEQSKFESDVYNTYLNLLENYTLQEAEDSSADNARNVQKELKYKFDKKIGAFTKMKLVLSAQNEKLLSKYKEKALACKPIGLTMQQKTFLNIKYLKDVDDKYINIIDKLIKDSDKLDKDKLKDFKKDNPISEIKKKYNEDYQSALSKAVKTEKNYKITPQDIKSAIKYLEEFKNKNDKISKEYNEEFNKMNKLSFYGTYVQELMFLKASLSFHKVQIQFELATRENNDARQVMILAAKHNPRNIKESTYENTHYVDSLIFEMSIDLDEFDFI